MRQCLNKRPPDKRERGKHIPGDRTSRRPQITAYTIQEPGICVNLTHIPDHHARKARETFRVRNDSCKSRASFISSSSTGVSRYAQHDLDIRVQRHSLCPVVPSVEVKVILRAGSYSERADTTVVVVELHPNDIEIHRSSQHGTVCSIGVGALRCRGQEPLLAGVGVHEGTELLAESGHVGDGGLKVEIEAVDHRSAEGTGRGGTGRVGAED